MSSPRIETERLLLRPPIAEDASAHAEMMADPLAAKFLTKDNQAQTPATAWRTFAMVAGHWSLQGFGFFSLIDRQTGAWAGRCGPWMPLGWPGFEIGWAVHPAFRGRGYALEAAVAAARWSFTELGQPHIISTIRPNNSNSQRVAQKLGERKPAIWTSFWARRSTSGRSIERISTPNGDCVLNLSPSAALRLRRVKKAAA